MPYTDTFLRVVLSGTLYSGEFFAFGFQMIHAGTGPFTVPSEVGGAMVTATETFWDNAKVNSHASLTTIKVNEIGQDGKYTNKSSTVLYDWASARPGAIGGTPPAQIALAISLRTAAKRGHAHAGRFYLPIPGITPNDDGLIGVTNQLAVRDAAKTYLDSVNNCYPGWEVGVVSKIGSGAQHKVTGVQVGRVLDTIRSRRTSLKETYGESAGLA